MEHVEVMRTRIKQHLRNIISQTPKKLNLTDEDIERQSCALETLQFMVVNDFNDQQRGRRNG